MYLSFVLFSVLLSVFTLSPPYWDDFQTGMVNWIPALYGNDWTYTSKLTYMGSKNKMRLDYFNFCEPHFNYTQQDNFFTCSYVFTDDTAYFVSKDSCCVFMKDFGAIKPDWLQTNAVLKGQKEEYQHKVNEWYVKDWDFHYYTDYYTGVPVGESGVNVVINQQVPCMYYLYDKSTQINETVFELDKSCQVMCPPEPPPGK